MPILQLYKCASEDGLSASAVMPLNARRKRGKGGAALRAHGIYGEDPEIIIWRYFIEDPVTVIGQQTPVLKYALSFSTSDR